MSDGLKYRPEEWEALAVKWDRLPEAEQEALLAQMTRAQERRFNRVRMKAVEGKRTFEQKLATREDVVHLILLFQQRQRIVERIEILEREAFANRPLRRRLVLRLAVWWTKVEAWLEAKGIRLVQMPGDPEAVPEQPTTASATEEPEPSSIEVVSR